MVLTREHDAIKKRLPCPFPHKVKDANSNEKTTEHWTGLCLSGGGIRSACFSLGVLEGLDRLPYTPLEEDGAKPGGDSKHNHLEFFDYVSSVSGGSCAAGHLATAMLPESGESKWLGSLSMTSKTVPSWLWGVGVWSLGMVFQLLKTGALLVSVLAFIAFCMRVLDAPDAGCFCSALGFDSDIKRGFVPFWLALWIFLVGYGLYVWRKARFAGPWFVFAAGIALIYVAFVSWFHDDSWTLPYWIHYRMLAILVVPVVLVLVLIVIKRMGSAIARFFRRPPLGAIPRPARARRRTTPARSSATNPISNSGNTRRCGSFRCCWGCSASRPW